MININNILEELKSLTVEQKIESINYIKEELLLRMIITQIA